MTKQLQLWIPHIMSRYEPQLPEWVGQKIGKFPVHPVLCASSQQRQGGGAGRKSDNSADTQEEDYKDNACFQLVESRGGLISCYCLLISCYSLIS